MIHFVRVLSRSDIEENRDFIARGGLTRYHGCTHWALASVRNPELAPLQVEGAAESLLLAFDDISVPDDAMVLATRQDAEALRDFAIRVHRRPERFLFVAQCEGGMGRSAAIGAYARLLAGLDERAYAAANPGLWPNTYLLDLLRD